MARCLGIVSAAYSMSTVMTMILDGLPGVEFAVPDGTLYLFVRIDGLQDSFALAGDLVRDYGVALAPGSAFGAGGEGALRICFAVEEDILREALARLKKAVAAGEDRGRS